MISLTFTIQEFCPFIIFKIEIFYIEVFYYELLLDTNYLEYMISTQL